jgi:rare lipoprotein A
MKFLTLILFLGLTVNASANGRYPITEGHFENLGKVVIDIKNSIDHDFVMLSSWYGYESGKFMANGKKWNPEALTVAHRTIPFGTKIKITNIKNGKSVIAIVTDRGPAKWTDRQLDVSMKIAKILGFKNAGITKVRVKIL